MPALEDHELAAIFPLMPDDDLAALADDIEANGLRERILLYEGKILDGRNRYRACVLKGLDQPVEHYRGTDPLAFVLSKNLHRRHLTESQRAMIAARLADLQTPNSSTRKAVTESAEAVSVSPRLVDSARVVVANGTPELIEAVDRGEVKVGPAEEVARLPKSEQKAAVKDGKVKEKAKEQRQKRKAAKKDTPADGTPDDDPPPSPFQFDTVHIPPDPPHHYAELIRLTVQLATRYTRECKAGTEQAERLHAYLGYCGLLDHEPGVVGAAGAVFLPLKGVACLVRLAGNPGKELPRNAVELEYAKACGVAPHLPAKTQKRRNLKAELKAKKGGAK